MARFAPIKHITRKAALGRRIWLPAMLNTFPVAERALHNEYDTLSAGQFSQPSMGGPNARQLRTLTADTIVVHFDAPWLVATGQHPYELRRRLSGILRYRDPVHLLVTINPNPWRSPPELDMFCTLREESKEVRPGEVEARYITLTISEWRDPQNRRRSSSSRKHGVPLPATHKLKATDTLSSLSFEYYGRYDWWRFIRDANGIPKRFGMKTRLVTLPGRWKVGYKVKIPKAPEFLSRGMVSSS